MGNKCCSKRQSDDIGAAGYKPDSNLITNLMTNAMDNRYTPDPNRNGALRPPAADFIRAGGLRRKLLNRVGSTIKIEEPQDSFRFFNYFLRTLKDSHETYSNLKSLYRDLKRSSLQLGSQK